MKILHCIAQLPSHTGSGLYFQNLIHQIHNHTPWSQGALFAVFPSTPVPNLIVDAVYKVPFDSLDLPFPIVGMSDEMPYPSTRYSQITPEMIQLWRQAFIQQLTIAKETFQPDAIIYGFFAP